MSAKLNIDSLDSYDNGESLLTANQAEATISDRSASGTITDRDGVITISKAGIALFTIDSPVAADDGRKLHIVSKTNYAHVITCDKGFNAKGTSGTATFTNTKGTNVTLMAMDTSWYAINCQGVTIA
jgi:hypothetical protein